ncbi:hypothetical protein [Galenea microaerophila]
MKKIALIVMTSLFISANASANEAPQGFGADMAAGFIAWKKDLQRYGGKEGQLLSHEVDTWIQTLKRVAQTQKNR